MMKSVKILYKDNDFAVLDNGSILFNYKIESDGLVIGLSVGQVVQDVDGYYHWSAGSMQGLWTANTLTRIAEILNALNKTWDEQVRKDFAHD